MPPEYQARGQVSARTDSFAFGMIAIELLTGLHPLVVRELIDENESECLAGLIEQHHDGEAAAPEGVAGLDTPSSAKCEWPRALLGEMCLLASRCARKEGRLRATIAEVLPELERLVVRDAAGSAEDIDNNKGHDLGTVYHDAAEGDWRRGDWKSALESTGGSTVDYSGSRDRLRFST